MDFFTRETTMKSRNRSKISKNEFRKISNKGNYSNVKTQEGKGIYKAD